MALEAGGCRLLYELFELAAQGVGGLRPAGLLVVRDATEQHHERVVPDASCIRMSQSTIGASGMPYLFMKAKAAGMLVRDMQKSRALLSRHAHVMLRMLHAYWWQSMRGHEVVAI